MAHSPTNEPRRPLLGRFLRTTIRILAAGLVLVALCYAEEDCRGWRDWNQFVEKQAALGIKIDSDFKRLVPPPVPDDQNFAATPFWKYLFSAEYLSQTPDSQARKDSPTNAATLATNLLALTDRLDPMFAKFRGAAARPFCRFNLDYAAKYPSTILFPHVFLLTDAAQIFRMRCIAELALNRIEDAASDVALALRLARATEPEPFLISHMAECVALHPVLRTIWDGLDRHQWSEEHLRNFENLLAGIRLPPLLERCLEGGQAGANRLFEDLRHPPKPLIHEPPPSGAILTGCQYHFVKQPGFLCTGFSSFLPTGWAYFEELNYNREMMEIRRAAWDRERETFSPSLFNREEGRVEFFPLPEFRALLDHRYLTWCLLFDLRCANAKKTAYAQTGVNLARVACALERYRLAKGAYPESLDALKLDWIKSLPKDIINGGPLHYLRPNPDSYRLNSVGWNERDDGGKIVYLYPEFKNRARPVVPDIDNGDWVWSIPGAQAK